MRRSSTIALWFVLAAAAHAQTTWVSSWTSSQQLAEPANSLAGADLADSSLRQVVHLSVGGPQLRVHLSNRFGTAPLRFTSVRVARPAAGSGTIDPATDRTVHFSGRDDVAIPAGAEYFSDPMPFPVAPLSDLAITVHWESIAAEQTGHPGSRATSFLAHGDQVSEAQLHEARKVEHWYFLAGIEVAAAADAKAVVTLGDSITDGHGATTDANDRWPDVLARRLQQNADTRTIAVLNHGIGGNRLLLDGLGPNALARFDHDVLAPPGVRYLIVLEGINDIGMFGRGGEHSRAEHQALVNQMIAAYEQILARAHAHAIQVIGATLLPFVGSDYYHPGAEIEADREAVNRWIRAAGHFDAVIDFDKLTRDPEHPDKLQPSLDSGDHLHPSPAGYAAMGAAIPLSLFK